MNVEPQTVCCSNCGIECTGSFHVCSRDEAWINCDECVERTVCGQGGHGERCLTSFGGIQ